MKKKTNRLVLHRETVQQMSGRPVFAPSCRPERIGHSDWTICDLCPETTPRQCIICCEPTGSCEH